MSQKTKRLVGLAFTVFGLALSLYNVYLHVQDHASEQSSSGGGLSSWTLIFVMVGLGFLLWGQQSKKKEEA